MATLDSTAVWDPGVNIYFERCLSKCCENVLCSFIEYSFTHLINEYDGIWRRFNKGSISLSTMIDELTRCEQELQNSTYLNIFSGNVKESITTLLQIFHMFSVLSSQNVITLSVIQELRTRLAKKSESDLYNIYNEYIDQLITRKSMVTEEDLCIGEIDPYYEFQLKLCFREKLIKQAKNNNYNEIMVGNVDFVMSMITKKEYKKLSKTCIFLLHMLARQQPGGILKQEECDNPCDQINTQWNNEGYKIKKLIGLLSRLMSLLPEYELDETITYYLLLVKNMKLDITPKYLHSVKTDPRLKLLFKLFWCGELINKGYKDSNIVNRCLNDFCRENKAECTAQILSIIDNSSVKSLLKEFLQCFLRKNLKTVTSMATQTHGNQGSGKNENLNSTPGKSKQDMIYAHCACIYSGKKMKNVDINQYLRKLNMKGPEDENKSEMQSEQVKLLILFILLLLVTALGHKSAKLKKYLALKYEYDMACLYLLWCSGDIEVHPGPTWRRKQLGHNSEQERKWLQDINSILLKLYWKIPTQSKPKNLWQRKPDHWPCNKPFHDTKNTQGKTLSDEVILTCLLECLVKKNIVIPKKYQCEISAWRHKMTQMLHKVQVLRIGTDNAKSAILNLLLVLEYEVKSLKDIKVSFENPILDKMEIENLLNNDQRQKKQAEMVADIIRDLISKLCRLSRGKDLAEKCDGIWNHPAPEHWPDDVPFFNPYNRGKCQKTCPDSKLLTTFLQLPHMKIPINLQVIVDAFKTMCNSTNTEDKIKYKSSLCREYILQSNMAKLENALQYMHEEGLFSREVYAILNQWQTTESVDEQAERVLKNANGRTDARPHIAIKITRNSQDTDLMNVNYIIPINNAYLHIQCITIHPNQLKQEEKSIIGSSSTTHNQENKDDSFIPPEILQFLSDNESDNQTEFSPKDNLFSVKDKNNDHETSCLECQGAVLSATNAYQETQTIVGTLTNQSSDFVRFCNMNDKIVDNLGNGDSGASTLKKRKLSEDSEAAKKQQKTKYYQNCADSIDNSASNDQEICSNDVLDSLSLNFRLIDQMHDMRDKCEGQTWEDSESDQETCYLESTESPNPQDSLEDNDDVKNNQNNLTDDKVLENCLDLVNYISGKPSEIETFLSQQPSIL